MPKPINPLASYTKENLGPSSVTYKERMLMSRRERVAKYESKTFVKPGSEQEEEEENEDTGGVEQLLADMAKYSSSKVRKVLNPHNSAPLLPT